MKRFLNTLIFLFFLSDLFSQSGTIRIAKPKKDTVIPAPQPKTQIIIFGHAGSNYTFKNSRKAGYRAGISLGPGYRINPFSHIYSIGLEYCREEENHIASAWNSEQQTSASFIGSSGTSSDYLKMPFAIGACGQVSTGSGRGGNFCLIATISPEYLLKTANADKRLGYSDLRQLNLSGSFTLGIILRSHYRIDVSYSKDFFDNLKDKNIYDASGNVMGKQRSKTNLLSLNITYGF
jgi:hypothetical protein